MAVFVDTVKTGVFCVCCLSACTADEYDTLVKQLDVYLEWNLCVCVGSEHRTAGTDRKGLTARGKTAGRGGGDQLHTQEGRREGGRGWNLKGTLLPGVTKL